MQRCSGVMCARAILCIILRYLAPSDRLRVSLPSCRVVKEFGIKACRECRFSHGGQMFAAVSGNTIGIYNTFTCEVVGNLRQAHVTPLPGVIVDLRCQACTCKSGFPPITNSGNAAWACLQQDAAHSCRAAVV